MGKGKKAVTPEVNQDVVQKAIALAKAEITNVGHACRYVHHYPAVAAALQGMKAMAYDNTLNAKENCTRLAVKVDLFSSKGKALKPGTKRDILRCYFRDNPRITPVVSQLVGQDTLAQAKVYNCFSQHVFKRLAKAEDKE